MADKENKTGGRPIKEVDWKRAEKLAAEFNTGEDIAADQNMSYDTLLLRIKDLGFTDFAEWLKKHSAKGRQSLRKKQFQVAMKGNPGMLQWLGKQYLEQADRIDTTNTNINATVDFKIGFDDEAEPNASEE